MSEIELKFGVLPARAGAIDAALRRAGARRLTLESRYFDTPDRRLADAGLSLRLRRSSGLWEQTLKAPAKGLGERLEENVLRPGRWGSDGPPLDPSLHDGTPAGERLREALGKGDPAPDGIAPAHACRVERRSIEIEAHGGRVEVAFDRGEVHAGTALAPVCELEYELKGGEPRALIEFGKEAVREHGAWLSTLTKAARGDRLARGETEGEPVKARPPVLDRGMDGAQVFRAALRACLDQVLANASEIGAGSRAAEAVHQLRVGIRRTRTAWRELAPLCPVAAADWEAPLVEAFRALGAFRDRHTVVASLQARLAASGAPEPTLAASDEAEPADPVEVVRAAAFQHALLDALALTLPGTGEPASAFAERGAGVRRRAPGPAAQAAEAGGATLRGIEPGRPASGAQAPEAAALPRRADRVAVQGEAGRALSRAAFSGAGCARHAHRPAGRARAGPRHRRGRRGRGLVQRRLADRAARRQCRSLRSRPRARRQVRSVLEDVTGTRTRS